MVATLVLEPVDRRYVDKFDEWLSVKENCLAIGYPGPYSAAGFIRDVLGRGIATFSSGIKGSTGPAGVSYAFETSPKTVDLHLSIFEELPPRERVQLYKDALANSVQRIFDVLGYEKISSLVPSESFVRVLVRMGATSEGRLLRYSVDDRPVYCVSIRKEEWSERYG